MIAPLGQQEAYRNANHRNYEEIMNWDEKFNGAETLLTSEPVH